MVTLESAKEHFSKSYVRAVAAVTRSVVVEPPDDVESVDLTIRRPNLAGSEMRTPILDLQLKATETVELSEKPEFSFELKAKNFNDLCVANPAAPRILVVMLVPRDTRDWLVHSEDELALRRCAYWASLRGLPPTPNTSSKTIPVSRSQVFDATQLMSIMRRVADGKAP